MSLLVELSKEDLLNICVNLPVGQTYADAEQLTAIGAARFTGNQHNESWSWNRSYLERMSETQLVSFYNKYKVNK